MTNKNESKNITPANGNIFTDLGFPPEEAATLQANSRRVILEKLNAKGIAISNASSHLTTKSLDSQKYPRPEGSRS